MRVLVADDDTYIVRHHALMLRAGRPAADVVDWLDVDPLAAAAVRDYLGAARLGIAALLATAPTAGDRAPWLHALIYDEHPSPAFSRARIERFAQTPV